MANNVKTEGKAWTSLINNLRQINLRYDENRKQAERNAKIAPAAFKCANCGKGVYTGKKDIEAVKSSVSEDIELIAGKIKIDHIYPFRPVTGEKDIFKLFRMLFSELDNYQVLCEDCHNYKSSEENRFRREFKKIEKHTEEWLDLLEEYECFMEQYNEKN